MNAADLLVPPWLKLAWRLFPWVLSGGLAIGLLVTVARLRIDRAECARAGAEAAIRTARAEAANEARKSAATDGYAQRTMAIQPIILHSKAAADAYAQTDAGRAPCLAADRVRSILDSRKTLFAFAPSSGAAPVPADAPVPDDADQR